MYGIETLNILIDKRTCSENSCDRVVGDTAVAQESVTSVTRVPLRLRTIF